MSRKRKSDQSSTETVSEQPPADVGTAVAELPAAEAPAGETKADGQSFADKVGQKKWTAAPDPFGIAKDNVAGVRLFEDRQESQMAIQFGEGRLEDKPSQAVIDKVKEAGYRWNPADRVWTFPVMPHSAVSTRIEAEKLYQEVRQMIREEKGIEAATPGVPF